MPLVRISLRPSLCISAFKVQQAHLSDYTIKQLSCRGPCKHGRRTCSPPAAVNGTSRRLQAPLTPSIGTWPFTTGWQVRMGTAAGTFHAGPPAIRVLRLVHHWRVDGVRREVGCDARHQQRDQALCHAQFSVSAFTAVGSCSNLQAMHPTGSAAGPAAK